MSELKATPGPWEVIFEEYQWLVGPEDRTFKDVFYAVAKRTQQSKLGNTDKANAHLIAAAPEMYKLLEIARCPNSDCIDGAIPYGQNPDGDWECSQCQWCYERDLVLAKARGEK